MRIDLHNAVRGALTFKETLQECREGEVALIQPCLGCGRVQWPRTKPATAGLVSVGDIHCFHGRTSAKACRVLWPSEGELITGTVLWSESLSNITAAVCHRETSLVRGYQEIV